MRKSLPLFIFIFILLLLIAIFLRGFGLLDKGFFLYDEAYLYLEAKPTVLAIQWTFKNLLPILKGNLDLDVLRNFIEQQGSGVYWPSLAKPGHYLLNVVFSLIFGIKDYTPFIMSFFFGVFTIIILFLLVKRFFGVEASLLAMAILTFSGYHILFSRLGLPVSNAVFFLVLATYFYYRAKTIGNKKLLILSGLSMGFAFTCHYSLLIFGLVLLFIEILSIALYKQKLKWKSFYSFFLFLASIVFMPLIVQFSYLLINCIAGKERLTYFGQLHGLIFNAMEYYGNNYMRLVSFLFDSESLIVLFFSIIGVVYFIYKFFKTKEFKYSIIFLLLFPLLSWQILGATRLFFPRTFVPILPFLALASGVLISKFSKKIQLLIVIPIAILGIIKNIDMITFKSGYRESCKYAKEYGDGKVIVTFQQPIFMFYLNKNDVFSAYNIDELKSIYKNQKANLYVSDFTIDLLRDFLKFDDLSIIEFNKKYESAISIYNPIGSSYPVICENYTSTSIAKEVKSNPDSNWIRIYNLDSIFN